MRFVDVATRQKEKQVFNRRKRPVYRRAISVNEILSGIVVIVVLLGAGGWLSVQQDAYDPSERDISQKMLEEGSVEDTLYRTPLSRWVEPGTALASAPQYAIGVFPEPVRIEGRTHASVVEAWRRHR
jgi:hypothetical protein